MNCKIELKNFIQHYGLGETKEALSEIEEEMATELDQDDEDRKGQPTPPYLHPSEYGM